MKKYVYILLLIISILMLLVTLMGMLGLALDEQYMVVDPVNDLSQSELEEFYRVYTIKSVVFTLLLLVSIIGIVFSFVKMIKK